MRRSILLSALAGPLAVLASVGSASAQTVDVEVYSGPRASYYSYSEPAYGYRYREPAYGYSSTYEDDDDRTVVIRRTYRRVNCGTYRYWDGTGCVDRRLEALDRY